MWLIARQISDRNWRSDQTVLVSGLFAAEVDCNQAVGTGDPILGRTAISAKVTSWTEPVS